MIHTDRNLFQSTLLPILQFNLTFTEWKSDIEKWFDYNWAKLHASPQKMPSHTRFELLDESKSHPQTTIQETPPVDEDPDADWMKLDFPPNPWGEDHVPRGEETEWVWGEFPPFVSRYDALWTYIFDLDRDAFSVNSVAHFRLSNMPTGFIRHLEYTDELEMDVIMPTKVDDVYLARNVVPEPPTIDQDLLQVYNTAQVSEMDVPEMSNHPKMAILSDLLGGLRRTWQSDPESIRKWAEWTPMDRQMQRFVWTMVRYSIWDGLSFVSKYNDLVDFDPFWGPDVNPAWKELNQLPSTIPMPSEPDYYVVTPTNKILISLATHLDVEDIVKMAIAKVINLTSEGTVQLACIISLDHIIIVNIDKTSPQVIISHTELLDLDGRGAKALIATLSPTYSHPASHLPNNGVLPIETVENIFKFLLLTGDVKTVRNFACSCKLFADIVRYRSVKIGRCTVLNFPTSRAGVFVGLDEKGNVEFYRLYWVRDVEYEPPKKTRSFRMLADDVNIGLGEYELISIKNGK